MIIDSHSHAWQTWPYNPPVPDASSRGKVEQLLWDMDRNGVDKAVLVCAQIEHNPANNDYADYLKWLAAGNAPQPADPTIVSIPSCSPRQIRQALTASGLRTAVESAVAAGSQDLKDWWEFSTTIERNHPEVIAMGSALGQTPEQLDALFTSGATL